MLHNYVLNFVTIFRYRNDIQKKLMTGTNLSKTKHCPMPNAFQNEIKQ